MRSPSPRRFVPSVYVAKKRTCDNRSCLLGVEVAVDKSYASQTQYKEEKVFQFRATLNFVTRVQKFKNIKMKRR